MPTHHAHLSRRGNKTSTRQAQAAKNAASSSRFRKCTQPASNLSDYQLSQVGFVQPDPGKLLCPIKSCGHRYAQPKGLYKHCRRKSDALHKKLAVAFGGRSCDFCHEDFKRLYDWERHMRKVHKSSPPIVEGLTPSHLSPANSSTPQPTGLQLQQRNAKINQALADRWSSQRQAPLLPDKRFQHCSNRASPHQHCRSGVGRRDPWVETSAYTGYTKVLQTGDLESNEESYIHSGRAEMYITVGLAREDNFNRLSVPLCQRPYGAPIFMHVIHGDISGVYTIIVRGEGSLWDHDPYGLGLLYVSQQPQG